ncbi:Tn3 family transposase [Nonomuraea sp. NPDC003709]|uniref:Tn3 family transposase n=1 Tax=Nonomuraea sp. NPDC003709 TaxID=3154450 RepID=UPI00339DDF61
MRAYDQNIFTEWHSRYGGRGILIYWHIERGSMVVHSQTLCASASEVHAMIEGAVRHGTTMKVEGNYVDSHGHVVTWTPHVLQTSLATRCSQSSLPGGTSILEVSMRVRQ